MKVLRALALGALSREVHSFVSMHAQNPLPPTAASTQATRGDFLKHWTAVGACTAAVIAGVAAPALADEYGVLKSESLVKNTGAICVKRSAINGRCEKYSDEVVPLDASASSNRTKVDRVKRTVVQEEPESDLIKRLRQKTVENKAKNEAMVAEKTFMNNQAGEFGPFSRYVLVKRPNDGKYELVLIRDLDDLKRQGIIESSGKAFVPGKEPSITDE
ncbi:hypothetical protein JKP88DRAFT_234458 [Tribonema minus]|uniref:Uncharacterized protein n=1 Tax=Tribonema minus TaxID=303371 RepID=A0A836CIW7_9STRA|nr:hypothetical protein JKP88DRAFT_234458 [Tribonema minus]